MSYADGTVALDRDITWASAAANLTVSGGHTLDVGAYTLSLAGNFSVAPNGTTFKHLRMASADSRLVVGGTMTVQGENSLSAGTVVLLGGFAQGYRGTALQPTGTLFVFDGTAAQNVSFQDANNSYFRNVDVRTGANVALTSNARVLGNLDLDGALSIPSARTLFLSGTLYFAGSLTNNGFISGGTCVDEGGTFSGTGNNPCP
jgi:phage baseplate assembly protein gpV